MLNDLDCPSAKQLCDILHLPRTQIIAWRRWFKDTTPDDQPLPLSSLLWILLCAWLTEQGLPQQNCMWPSNLELFHGELHKAALQIMADSGNDQGVRPVTFSLLDNRYAILSTASTVYDADEDVQLTKPKHPAVTCLTCDLTAYLFRVLHSHHARKQAHAAASVAAPAAATHRQ
jgi:hypothetical protein